MTKHHLKNIATPKIYSLPKKSKKYVVRPKPGKKFEESVSIVVLLRDFLKLATNVREVKIMLNNKEVLINQTLIKNKSSAVGFFDVISIKSLNKNYLLLPSKHGFNIRELSPELSQQLFLKITNIKTQTKNKQQIQFNNGYTLISDKNAKVGDTAIIEAKTKKIKNIIKLKGGLLILSTKGAHIGKTGRISKIKGKHLLLDNSIKTIKQNTIIVPEEYASVILVNNKSKVNNGGKDE